MKKNLFLTALCCLFVSASFAESPLAPKEPRAQLINYLMWRNIEFLSIPVYLSTPRDANIKYCWYSTRMAFGEKVRTSEEPYRTEEGMYTKGRLTMYHKNDIFYKFEWNHDGSIKSITLYNENGDSRGSIANKSYRWYSANSSVNYYIGGVRYYYHVDALFVLTKFENTKDICDIEGYSVKDGYIVWKVYDHYRSNYKRKDYEHVRNNNEYKRVHISQIWSGGKDSFNPNDPVMCSKIEF